MPVLKNAKWEMFANHMARSPKTRMSQAKAYLASGYRTTGHAAEVAASRLLKRVEIQQRIAEINEPVVRKTRASVDTLAAQFDAVFEGAVAAAQFGAAGNAAGLKAKLLGFMREKIEVGGVGEFNDCATQSEVLERLVDEDPHKMLEFAQAVCVVAEARIASKARDVTAVMILQPPRRAPPIDWKTAGMNARRG